MNGSRSRFLRPYFALLLLAAALGCGAADRPLTRDDFATTGDYRRQTVGDGLEIHTYQAKNVFGAPQNITLAVIDPARWQFGIGHCGDRYRTVSDIAKKYDAAIAVNAGFFVMKSKTPTAAMTLIIDGKIIGIPRNRAFSGVLRFQPDGKPEILRYEPGCHESFANVLQSYPLLVAGGKAVEDFPKNIAARNPRTAIGLRPDGTILVLTADGRSKQAAGLSFPELAALFVDLGCDSALNLDGGGSTTFFAKGKGVLNHPSDNRKFDHAGERRVNDILYFKKK